jgi:RHS repeat-associated protein
VNNPQRYAGYRWDEETGLYYLNARYYAPEIGRFITRDEFHGFAEEPASLNWYNYAHSNPVTFVDNEYEPSSTASREHLPQVNAPFY